MTLSKSVSVSRRASRQGGGVLMWVLMLLLLAAVGYGGWLGWLEARQRLDAFEAQQRALAQMQQDVGALRKQTEALATADAGVTQRVEAGAQALATLNQELEGQSLRLSRLGDAVDGNRSRVALAAVEQLLLTANERLLLARDPATAQIALEQADRRLARLSDPRLLDVRQAITAELESLSQVPVVDRTGAALTLGNLMQRAPQLPLRARVAKSNFQVGAAKAVSDLPESALERVWIAVRTAVSSLFALRRTDEPPPRLLAPEQEALVHEVLSLKLEGARLALLSGQTAAFRDLLQGSRQWLETHFDAGHSGVQSATRKLQSLESLELAPDLPDISGSLQRLRTHLGSTAQ